ncbi:MAG: hypothetical protein QXP03_03825 [Desulfurococcaceae archaeon]
MAGNLSRTGTSPLVIPLLAVNTVIISGIVVRIGHLYRAGTYTHYDWVVGVAIITLMCITALHAFAGYAVIASKKLYRGVLAGATTAQVASLIVVTAMMADPVILMGLAASVATTITIIASLYRAPSQ